MKRKPPKPRRDAVAIQPAILEYLVSNDFHGSLVLCRDDAERRALRALYFFTSPADRARIEAEHAEVIAAERARRGVDDADDDPDP